jgi:hypothetical protein
VCASARIACGASPRHFFPLANHHTQSCRRAAELQICNHLTFRVDSMDQAPTLCFFTTKQAVQRLDVTHHTPSLVNRNFATAVRDESSLISVGDGRVVINCSFGLVKMIFVGCSEYHQCVCVLLLYFFLCFFQFSVLAQGCGLDMDQLELTAFRVRGRRQLARFIPADACCKRVFASARLRNSV